MNNNNFISWLNGYVDAINGIPTQAQWDLLKNKLAEEADKTLILQSTLFPFGTTVGIPFGVPNTAPIINPTTTTSSKATFK